MHTWFLYPRFSCPRRLLANGMQRGRPSSWDAGKNGSLLPILMGKQWTESVSAESHDEQFSIVLFGPGNALGVLVLKSWGGIVNVILMPQRPPTLVTIGVIVRASARFDARQSASGFSHDFCEGCQLLVTLRILRRNTPRAIGECIMSWSRIWPNCISICVNRTWNSGASLCTALLTALAEGSSPPDSAFVRGESNPEQYCFIGIYSRIKNSFIMSLTSR